MLGSVCAYLFVVVVVVGFRNDEIPLIMTCNDGLFFCKCMQGKKIAFFCGPSARQTSNLLCINQSLGGSKLGCL